MGDAAGGPVDTVAPETTVRRFSLSIRDLKVRGVAVATVDSPHQTLELTRAKPVNTSMDSRR